MADVQVHPLGDVTAPAAARIPGSAEWLIKACFASFDGTGASGSFQPCLRIISDAGTVVAESATSETVAAGASADVSWFPRVAASAAASGGGIQFDVDNVGDWLEVETTAIATQDFSQPYASRQSFIGDYGAGLNINGGFLITSPPDSNFNYGNPVVEIDQYAPSNDYGAFGLVIQTATRNATSQGIQSLANGNGTFNAEAIVATAAQGSSGTADAIGVDASAINRGTGKEIAVSCAAAGVATGANSLALRCLSSLGAAIFEVRDDGSIHGLASVGAIIWDL